MNTTNNESVGQKIDLFEQSKESLLDFNVNNVINNMASFLSVNKDAIRRTNTDKCAILSVPLPKAIMIDDLTEDIEKLLKLSILLSTSRMMACAWSVLPIQRLPLVT